MDLLILLALNSSNMIRILTPTILAYNLGLSRSHASRRLSKLTEEGYVEKIEDGKYELTDKGCAYLEGELDTSELESGNDG